MNGHLLDKVLPCWRRMASNRSSWPRPSRRCAGATWLDQPAAFTAAGMRVMPNLSVSTMLGMALLSAGAYAVRRGLRGEGSGQPTGR